MAWARAARRAWLAVLLAAAAASAGAVAYVVENLGMNTDTADMISPSLDWRQSYIDYQRQFPQFSNTLAIVIDATSADLAADAARRLVAALTARGELFESVRDPQDDPFFRRNALLFLDADERDRLVADVVAAQPLLGRLHRDPSLATVLGLLADALEADVTVTPQTLALASRELAAAIDAAIEDRFYHLSWRRLFASADTPAAGDVRHVVVAAPALDFGQLFPAADAIAVVRETAKALGLTPERGVRVRVTGGLAMSDEELHSVSRGAERAAVLALLGVALVLTFGLGSARLVIATLITLVVGLLWTAAFAAAAVGHLNMISIAFAVLYIGLGVDYAVHYGLRYRELLAAGHAYDEALDRAAGDVGASVALCALTTGAGFFAFLPTSFAGVSELGLIAGVGMFVSLIATLTLMPALLVPMRPRRRSLGRFGIGLPMTGVLDRVGHGHPRRVAGVAAAVAVVCVLVASGARFDHNPLNLRDPAGEAVSTYRDLVASDDTWSLDVLVPGDGHTDAVVRGLEALKQVRRVVSLESYVPEDQPAALARVEELVLLLGPDLDGPAGKPSVAEDAAAGVARLRRLLSPATASRAGMEQLAGALARFEGVLDGADPAARAQLLERLQHSVTATLTGEIERLGDMLDASAVSLDALPPALMRDWRAPDGRMRLQVDAAGDLNDRAVLEAFVDAVRDVAPAAVGTPVVHLESGRVVVSAFIEAFALALGCIALILYLAFRRLRDVAVVLVPLLLAALASAAIMVVIDMPFNFANVIALPLLLGVGVDSGIHMLARAHAEGRDTSLAASATARGVVTSALTTMVGFGNLAFSPHPGTASMGLLLTVGMVVMLASTLLVLPALVRLSHGSPTATESA